MLFFMDRLLIVFLQAFHLVHFSDKLRKRTDDIWIMKLPNFLLGFVEESANHSLVPSFNTSENISGTLDNQLFLLELSVEGYCKGKLLTLAFKTKLSFVGTTKCSDPVRSSFNLPSFNKKGI
jgi:hypothetical protein